MSVMVLNSPTDSAPRQNSKLQLFSKTPLDTKNVEQANMQVVNKWSRHLCFSKYREQAHGFLWF